MKRLILVLFLVMVLGVSSCDHARMGQVGVGPGEKQGSIKVVVVTGGHDFSRAPFFSIFESFEGIDYVEALQKGQSEIFEDISGWQYDVIVLYNATLKISPKRRANFVKLLDSGVGVVALHHAMAAFGEWPEYKKIIGAKYYMKPQQEQGVLRAGSDYKHGADIKVHVEDTEHPITRGMDDFAVHDETYKNCGFEVDNHALLTTDEASSDRTICWVRDYGNARVFCIQLGHGVQIYTDKNYRRIIDRAIRWSAGRLD